MKKVLILEDNIQSMELIRVVLEELDIKCVIYSCNNINEAYQIVLEQTINLFVVDIILDTSIPGDTSGLKFVSSIREIDRYVFTPVIFVTSLEDSKFYSYEKLHCYSFVEKPFNTEELKKILAKCLLFPDPVKEEKNLFLPEGWSRVIC